MKALNGKRRMSLWKMTKSEQRRAHHDWQKLASLMIEHNVGISVETTYEIKRLDNDYFEE